VLYLKKEENKTSESKEVIIQVHFKQGYNQYYHISNTRFENQLVLTMKWGSHLSHCTKVFHYNPNYYIPKKYLQHLNSYKGQEIDKILELTKPKPRSLSFWSSMQTCKINNIGRKNCLG
jgi:hypothetical protein